MLNNLSNFFNIIKERRTKKTLEPSDLIAIGTRQSKSLGDYKPTAIQFSDLQEQLGGDINLAVTRTSGPATFIDGVLNIPDYNDADPKVYRAKIAMQTIDWAGYGYLYNWYAVSDARNLANPTGGTGLTAPNQWRVPTYSTDWLALGTFAGGTSVAGGKLKSKVTSSPSSFSGWFPGGQGTDNYNFNAVPGGYRALPGYYGGLSGTNIFWTLDSFRMLLSSANSELLSESAFSNSSKSSGYSVRLVREATASELLLNDGDTSEDTGSLDPYIGNNGTEHVTVKIGTQIWLAQNLRETLYNNSDPLFNASILGGDDSAFTWETRGFTERDAWTAYSSQNGTVDWDPTTITTFYNDVLENTLDVSPGQPTWFSNSDANGPFYMLNRNRWNKTHIKITPGYDVSDYPTINERSLLIERAVEGDSDIKFRPIKRTDLGILTIENLNNYNDLLGASISYIYVEILEYTPAYYGSGLSVGVGVSNL